MNTAERIEAWHKRLQAARQIVAQGGVRQVSPNVFIVKGSSGEHTVAHGECDCEDARMRKGILGYCKHRLAVELWLNGSIHD